MKYIIVDLEATCWEGRGNPPNEIIEIGAVLVNEQLEIESEFQRFVKPIKHPILSDFCKELTTITQVEVDQAQGFPEVLQQFQDWFDLEKGNYLLCSWGFYDKKQFQEDCLIYGLPTDWTLAHISLKHQYWKIKGLRRKVGLKKALELEQLELTGTHHRGIDDARNITKIFLRHAAAWEMP
ncbi:MAG: 3'-5' exonuclease [Bacteroidota bacterium]